MKTILICHKGDLLTEHGFSRWLSSFSDLVGIVKIQEDGARSKQRIKTEIKRSGFLRFIFDILPYRLFSKIAHSKKDDRWVKEKIKDMSRTYPDLPDAVKVLVTHSPNSPQAIEFVSHLAPDMILARCKTLIDKDMYSIPVDGTLILHPGICPEYRNAHGCFWALANNEPDKVGATLLKIDEGVDTGPVYGYYSYPFNVATDTPAIIHGRVVYDNLGVIKAKLLEIHAGEAGTIVTSGRRSGVWGQPWLSRYIKLRRRAVKK
jgi:hypothetical protein